jgi:hypothetical protein
MAKPIHGMHTATIKVEISAQGYPVRLSLSREFLMKGRLGTIDLLVLYQGKIWYLVEAADLTWGLYYKTYYGSNCCRIVIS